MSNVVHAVEHLAPWAVYTIGWMLALPGALRRRMLATICSACGGQWAHHSNSARDCRRRGGKDIPRGAMRERNGWDVLAACGRALCWPVMLPVRIMRFLARHGSRTINRAVPLTAPELERRMTEQRAEIDRLTKQIESDTKAIESQPIPASEFLAGLDKTRGKAKIKRKDDPPSPLTIEQV